MDIIMTTLERAGYPLRDYQMSGVKWMRQHEANGNGGILADEPGLGKTIQALALAVPEESHPTLIVVPKSVVNQWRELAEIIFGKDLVYVFQGSNKKQDLGEYRIVITTYTTLILNGGTSDPALLWLSCLKNSGSIGSQESIKAYQSWSKQPKALRNIWEKRARKTVSPLRKTHWTRVILDEAHRIKNHKTNGYETCCSLKTRYRWALTGTPVQNRYRELKTLFTFVLPDQKEVILRSRHASTLQPIIDQFLLRRKKSDFLDQLPPIVEEVVEVNFETQREQDIYTRVHQQVFDQIAQLQDPVSTKGGLSLIVIEHLLRLRQAAQHPSLFIDAMGRKLKSSTTTDDTSTIISSKHNRLLQLIQATPNKPALVFFQFTAEMSILKPLFESNGIDVFQLNGTMSLSERYTQIQQAKEAAIKQTQGGSPCAFFIQIVAGGAGLNLQEFSQVFILSPDWNPFNEVQAIGRSYRSGQKSPVLVRRLVLTYPPKDPTTTTTSEIDQTIDQRIQYLQNKKLDLAALLLNDPSIHQKSYRKTRIV